MRDEGELRQVKIGVVVDECQGWSLGLGEHPDSPRVVWERQWKERRLSLPPRQAFPGRL
jgi:hypothetical protein